MSPDGLVLPVGGDATADVSRLPQIRLKLQPGELAEVLDPDVQLSELMVGHLEQSGHGVSSAATHTFGRTGGFSLKTVMAMLPESSALKAVSEVVTPGFEFAFARNRSVNMSVTNAGPGGGVEDNRGESVLFEGAASWELELRTSALDEWSFVDTIDSSGPRDADALKVWVSGAYTVPPPAKTVDLTQGSTARTCGHRRPRTERTQRQNDPRHPYRARLTGPGRARPDPRAADRGPAEPAGRGD
jgi:hypothetical protein